MTGKTLASSPYSTSISTLCNKNGIGSTCPKLEEYGGFVVQHNGEGIIGIALSPVEAQKLFGRSVLSKSLRGFYQNGIGITAFRDIHRHERLGSWQTVVSNEKTCNERAEFVFIPKALMTEELYSQMQLKLSPKLVAGLAKELGKPIWPCVQMEANGGLPDLKISPGSPVPYLAVFDFANRPFAFIADCVNKYERPIELGERKIGMKGWLLPKSMLSVFQCSGIAIDASSASFKKVSRSKFKPDPDKVYIVSDRRRISGTSQYFLIAHPEPNKNIKDIIEKQCSVIPYSAPPIKERSPLEKQFKAKTLTRDYIAAMAVASVFRTFLNGNKLGTFKIEVPRVTYPLYMICNPDVIEKMLRIPHQKPFHVLGQDPSHQCRSTLLEMMAGNHPNVTVFDMFSSLRDLDIYSGHMEDYLRGADAQNHGCGYERFTSQMSTNVKALLNQFRRNAGSQLLCVWSPPDEHGQRSIIGGITRDPEIFNTACSLA